MKNLFLVLACLMLVFALYADPNEGETAGLIENFEDGQSCLQHPTYSGTSSGHDGASSATIVDYRFNWRLDPEAAWYDEEEPGTHSLLLEWTWIEDTEELYKMRVTTHNRPNARNDVTGPFQFKIWDSAGVGFYYYYMGEPIWVGISIREDPTGEGDIYELTQFAELTPEDDWQYVYFDFTEPGIFEDSFWVDDGLGIGELTTESPLLEGLFFVPVGGMETELSDDWAVEIFIDDLHYGAPHTPADPPTSASSWMLFH